MPSMKHIKERKTLSPGSGRLVEYSLKVQKQKQKQKQKVKWENGRGDAISPSGAGNCSSCCGYLLCCQLFWDKRGFLLLPLSALLLLVWLPRFILLQIFFLQKSFRDLEDSECEKGGFESYVSSRKRRAIRKAEKKAKNWPLYPFN